MDDAEALPTERPNRCPTHPGVVLRNTVLPALHLNVKAAATERRISRQTLHRILAGEVAITPSMAVRLGVLRKRPIPLATHAAGPRPMEGGTGTRTDPKPRLQSRLSDRAEGRTVERVRF